MSTIPEEIFKEYQHRIAAWCGQCKKTYDESESSWLTDSSRRKYVEDLRSILRGLIDVVFAQPLPTSNLDEGLSNLIALKKTVRDTCKQYYVEAFAVLNPPLSGWDFLYAEQTADELVDLVWVETDSYIDQIYEQAAHNLRTKLATEPIVEKQTETSQIKSDNSASRIKKHVNCTLPRRAAWLKAQMKSLKITCHRLMELGGGTPNNKTIQKILNGAPVQDRVLDSLITALSFAGSKVSLDDIPSD